MTPARKRVLMTWVGSLVAIIVIAQIQTLLGNFRLSLPPLGWLSFLSWCVFITLTLWLIAVTFRFILRKLFWRVGRRLALSYFLIGFLPFVFFAILLLITGYLTAAILSQATFRNERQNMLETLDRWNLEYALTGGKPASMLSTLEIYDSRDDSLARVPEWLQTSSFVGLTTRESQAIFVSARRYERADSSRTIVLAQPMDDQWTTALEKRSGMMASPSVARREGEDDDSRTSTIQLSDEEMQLDLDDEQFAPFFRRAWNRNGVIWGDIIPSIIEWETGEPKDNTGYFVLFSNPWSNLLDFYFGSSKYVSTMLGLIGGIAGMMAIVYFLAALLAGGLIFSISRAINRIDKGTKAVERGDFSYRINMKRQNQLGEVAVSFDHMTQSLGSLLSGVAEQERLQSEISIAASIQRNLLPKEGPRFAGISFSAHFEPTASIGGDYYDLFNLDKTRLAVTIGDVSGHGLSTGLVMAMVKAAITTLVEQGADEDSLFHRLNELVIRSTERRTFMTLGFTLFDMQRRTIRHTNAGHIYPYLLRYGDPPRPLEAPSLPLGIRDDINPQTIEVELREKDTLVYLSDGIVEAQNAAGDPFGFEALERMLVHLHDASPADIQTTILDAVAVHSGNHPADDDRTIMILRFDQIEPMAGAQAEVVEAVLV
ncbi:MAG TPA: SpoIIE family protein phosphatase [Thermoanaerobaculia bacterium]|nr:SpoIIE family protein phosphatase [Thermoanaerobaculia bacterium]